MANGMSTAHARQSKANESRRNVRRANAVTERNKLLRLMRHMKRVVRMDVNKQRYREIYAGDPKKAIATAWKKAAAKVPNAFSNDLIRHNPDACLLFGI